MPQYYPVFLDLKDRLCVIVGGGEIAERKIAGLLECGASISMISPEVTPGIRARADAGDIRWEAREYADGDLKGAFLAIASTDDESVNRAVHDEASREGIVLNVVDRTALCSFIAPAVVRRGDDYHLTARHWARRPEHPREADGQLLQPSQAAGWLCEATLPEFGGPHGPGVGGCDSRDHFSDVHS